MKFCLRAALVLLSAALLCGCAPQPPSLLGEHRDVDGAVCKKGLCVSRYDDGSEESAERLSDLGISWYYNWGMTTPAQIDGIEYVPMVWGAGGVNENNLSRLEKGIADGTYKHLLTFNEPDKNAPGVSSGVSVETALDLWPQLEALGVPLSSPAPADYSTGWLDEFMEGAIQRGYRVDFIALHSYQDFSDPDAPEELSTLLTEVYEKYALPIWITEFATIDITVWGGDAGKPACTEEAALAYIKGATDVLESLGFVERYAWWIDNTGSPSEARSPEAKFTFLFENDDTLSPTGEIYQAIPSRYPLVFRTESLSVAKADKFYEFLITAEGGKGGYTFALYGDSTLPQGLTLEAGGKLSGTVSEAGTYTFRVAARDEDGQLALHTFTLSVE